MSQLPSYKEINDPCYLGVSKLAMVRLVYILSYLNKAIKQISKADTSKMMDAIGNQAQADANNLTKDEIDKMIAAIIDSDLADFPVVLREITVEIVKDDSD